MNVHALQPLQCLEAISPCSILFDCAPVPVFGSMKIARRFIAPGDLHSEIAAIQGRVTDSHEEVYLQRVADTARVDKFLGSLLQDIEVVSHLQYPRSAKGQDADQSMPPAFVILPTPYRMNRLRSPFCANGATLSFT